MAIWRNSVLATVLVSSCAGACTIFAWALTLAVVGSSFGSSPSMGLIGLGLILLYLPPVALARMHTDLPRAMGAGLVALFTAVLAVIAWSSLLGLGEQLIPRLPLERTVTLGPVAVIALVGTVQFLTIHELRSHALRPVAAGALAFLVILLVEMARNLLLHAVISGSVIRTQQATLWILLLYSFIAGGNVTFLSHLPAALRLGQARAVSTMVIGQNLLALIIVVYVSFTV